MRFETSRRRSAEDDSILPLINVVFLLLIFYMLAGRLAASDPLNVAPPRSASEGAADLGEAAVSIAADGRLALDGRIVDETALVAALRDRLAETPGLPVTLKADGQVDSARAVAVMERLRDAGAVRLKLLTVPESR